MPKIFSAIILLTSLCTNLFAQSHTSPGGGAPDIDLDRGETCRFFKRQAILLESSFVTDRKGKYSTEEDFFNLLSKVTLKADLKLLEQTILPKVSSSECHSKIVSELQKIKALYILGGNPGDNCYDFQKRVENIPLLDSVIKLYEK